VSLPAKYALFPTTVNPDGLMPDHPVIPYVLEHTSAVVHDHSTFGSEEVPAPISQSLLLNTTSSSMDESPYPVLMSATMVHTSAAVQTHGSCPLLSPLAMK